MALFSPILRAQIVKELLALLRSPRARFSIIMPPILQLFVFSFAMTLDVKNINMAVFNQDNGAYSQEFVTGLAKSGFVGKFEQVHSQKQLEERVQTGKVLVAVNIPENFSTDIIEKRHTQTQILIDGRRANSGQIVTAYIQAIASNLGASINQTKIVGHEAGSIRYWYNPGLVFQWFVVPSLAAILVNMSALGIAALSLATERELGTFDQLLVTPASYFEIIVAKSVPSLIIAPLLALLMVFIAIVFFKIPFTGSFWVLVLTLYVHVFAVVGIGLSISAVCDTQQQAIMGIFTFMVPMMLMSGFTTPYENMPHFLQMIAQGIPNKHSLLIVQGVFLKSHSFVDVFSHLWPMIVIGCVSMTFATLIVRSKLQ